MISIELREEKKSFERNIFFCIIKNTKTRIKTKEMKWNKIKIQFFRKNRNKGKINQTKNSRENIKLDPSTYKNF